jgi:hypothetical protein
VKGGRRFAASGACFAGAERLRVTVAQILQKERLINLIIFVRYGKIQIGSPVRLILCDPARRPLNALSNQPHGPKDSSMTSPLIIPNPSQTVQAQGGKRATKPDRIPLALCDLDEFEEGLLPVLRHFFLCLAQPERQTWQFAYKIAAERWGEARGLPLAHALFKLVQFIVKARRTGFDAIDPLALEQRDFVTRDEQALLQMLHHMRRDETPRAREAVANVTGCTMDPDVIRAGLSFADHFPATPAQCKRGRNKAGLRSHLRVVG